ncbi:MAG: glycosyltransferase family 2 protein [bacterium]
MDLLSVVIIGRNESENLERLADSVDKLKEFCSFPVETVFIDSASEDDSVLLAQSRFDRVYEIIQDPRMCASAGRHVGTNKAKFEWIFYIDADMEIRPEFLPVIESLKEAPADWQGIIGDYIHHFDDGSTAAQTFEGDVFRSEWAGSFGGAVILRRDSVIRAGNWNPGVYGKEEMNLYSRIGNGARVVWYAPVPMINHFSEKYSRFELFKRLLYPSAGQGKVFYGYGQSVRALLHAGMLAALVRLEPEPFLVWTLLTMGLISTVFLPGVWGGVLLVAAFMLLVVWMRPGPLLRFLTLPLQILAGWGRYPTDYLPELKDDPEVSNQAPGGSNIQ